MLFELVRQLGWGDGQALLFDRIWLLSIGAQVVMGERSILVLGL